MIHSFGGQVTLSWRLVNLIRQFAGEFNILIPLHAFSAATLTAMGADSIVMLPAACLGPTDPSSNSFYNPKEGQNILPISVEDLAYYIKFIKEDMDIKSESGIVDALKILSQSDNRVHPIALGAAKRGSNLAKKYAAELLSMNKKYQQVRKAKIVKTFSSDLFAHDHPINREEAKRHGLRIIKESGANEDLIWELFKGYEDFMNMAQRFDPTAEFKKLVPTLPLSLVNNLQPVTQSLPDINMAVIESTHFASINKRKYDVTGIQILDAQLGIKEFYSWIIKANEWAKEV